MNVIVSIFYISRFVAYGRRQNSTTKRRCDANVSCRTRTRKRRFKINKVTLFSAIPTTIVIKAINIVPTIYFIIFFVMKVGVVRNRTVITNGRVSAKVMSYVVIVVVEVGTSMRVAKAKGAPYDIPDVPRVSLRRKARTIAMATVPFDPSTTNEREAGLVRPTNVPNFYSRFSVSGSQVMDRGLRGKQVIG